MILTQVASLVGIILVVASCPSLAYSNDDVNNFLQTGK